MASTSAVASRRIGAATHDDHGRRRSGAAWPLIVVPTRASTSGLDGEDAIAFLEQERSDIDGARVQLDLLGPLGAEPVGERIDEPARERPRLDPVDHLDVDGHDPEQLRQQEERHRDPRAVGGNNVGPLGAQHPPREQEVPQRVGKVARRRVVGPNRPLPGQQGHRLRCIERHPEAVVVPPPRFQAVELGQMPPARCPPEEHTSAIFISTLRVATTRRGSSCR